MSFSRFGADGSDVYTFPNIDGQYECCMCPLQEREWVDDPDAFFGAYLKRVGPTIQDRFDTVQGFIDHLKLHTDAGHHVPEYVAREALAWDAGER